MGPGIRFRVLPSQEAREQDSGNQGPRGYEDDEREVVAHRRSIQRSVCKTGGHRWQETITIGFPHQEEDHEQEETRAQTSRQENQGARGERDNLTSGPDGSFSVHVHGYAEQGGRPVVTILVEGNLDKRTYEHGCG